jgi:hypothetical protein
VDKIIQFESRDSWGNVFAESIDVTPKGGGLEKIAGKLHPEVQQFIRCLRPDPKYQYVLMTPMGAFEFWGMNVNGDVFPEAALAFNLEKDDPMPVIKALEEKWLRPFGKRLPPGNYKEFGHKTFMKANRYKHHVNKNPELSYGIIALAVWNPNMKRVEVIVRHDRELAKKVGAEDIIDDLDEGKGRQISMGCKVPFDICTKCGNVSRTQGDYCSHLRMGMGSINNDGSINGAVNLFPRFFDLSDVFVPAAKESGVLMKVASVRGVAQVKSASQRKLAEITKKVLPNSGYKAVSQCWGAEPDLPMNLMERSGRGGTLEKLLTTLAMLGVVAKPREFQHGMLHRMGRGRMAESLRSRGQVFSPTHDAPRSSFSADDYSPSLARLLSGVLEGRSGFYPHLPRRMVRIIVIKAEPSGPSRVAPESDVLKKVASAYCSYRNAFQSLPAALDLVVGRDPEYYNEHFFGDLLTDSLEKTASFHSATLSTPLVPLYLYNAYGDGVSEPPRAWNMRTTSNSPANALLQPAL